MRLLFILSLFLLLGACGKSAENAKSPEPADSTMAAMAPYEEPAASSSYDEALTAAITAIDQSAARGHAWSTADLLLSEAAAAAAEGDNDKAMKLADRARVQADLAVRQADREDATWRDRVLSE